MAFGVSCSKQESSSTWTTRRWGGIPVLLDLVLNLCVASETEMSEEEALARKWFTSMKKLSSFILELQSAYFQEVFCDFAMFVLRLSVEA